MTYLPLKNAINQYAGSDPARFHMPGHKGSVSPIDVTELSCTDDLQKPCNAILESEQLCAKRLGARDAFFLVNGSTAGNLAMLSLLKPGERILLSRNCHKSVINGISLAGIETVSIFPDNQGIISREAVDKALSKNPCAAVFITSPTYRGAVSDIRGIAETAHLHGALLFVDCAHGAHFAYSEKLPAVPSSADAWCISTHKTLAAVTQTAVLCLGVTCPFTREFVQRRLNMFQSTSPSYLLMTSIESSVLEPQDWNTHIERIKRFRESLLGISEVSILDCNEHGSQDITRLNISYSGLSGYDLAERLENESIFPEMADSKCVTLITTPSDKEEWYERVLASLKRIDSSIVSSKKTDEIEIEALCGSAVLSVRGAVTAESDSILLHDSVGMICAEAVGCYPPGVSVLFPGETITRSAVDFLEKESSLGAELFGVQGEKVTIVRNSRE